ncbi:MAG TPA: GTA-gp10 family protein [Sphingomicrobium sp.]|nr:GTA-gp10 family protein [Sphingomicrobium sp.]
MSNPLRGESVLRAGDTEKTLVFDVNAFCELEADTGLGLTDLIEQLQGNPSFSLLRSVFCAGLQAKHPGTTKAEAGTIMSDAGVEEITRALQSALEAAMPAPKAGSTNPPRKRGAKAG